jgi:ribosomal protein S13
MKKTKMKTIEVPANLFKRVGDLVSRLIADNAARKPIKRVVKISDKELKALLKKGKAAKKVLDDIWTTLDREGNRLSDIQEHDLTTADLKWVESQYMRLARVADPLDLDTNF